MSIIACEWECNKTPGAAAATEAQPNQGMETDALQLTLRFSFRARLMPSVRVSAGKSRHSGEGCKSLTVKV